MQRNKHTSLKVQKLFTKCRCKACVWNICYCFVVRRMHLSYVQNSCLLAFLQRARCLASLQYVSCIIPCNTTPCGLRIPLWKACKSCPSRVVRSYYVCCLPDNIPVCVSSSPVMTQQGAGRCTACAKRPCNQVSPCLSSQQLDNPALCNYAVK